MNRLKRWRLLAITAVGAAALMVPASAGAFGTINGLGQKAEHEKITKALSCGADDPVASCFESKSMDLLSGRDGTVGGVGLPDRVTEIKGHANAHCDDGDYLPGKPYESSDAKRAVKAIVDCVDLFNEHMTEAVDAAGGMATDKGVVGLQADLSEGCPWDSDAGNLGFGVGGYTAKCKVVDKLGRALHAAEDFWSHTNWGDEADPNEPIFLKGAAAKQEDATADLPATDDAPTYNLTNPPGLGHTEVVPFLTYPVDRDQVPTEAEMLAGDAPISGCDDSADNIETWIQRVTSPAAALLRGKVDSCPNRVTHTTLNKDKGTIDWKTGKTSDPLTPRGKIGDNFQRAVTGARKQVRAIWGDFVNAVDAKYGDARGALIIQAFTHDTPWTSCKISGKSPYALDAPNGGKSSLRSVETQIRNETGQPFGCGEAVLDHGVWGSAPASQIETGSKATFRTESNLASFNVRRQEIASGGPEGNVTYTIGTTGYTLKVSWDNPLIGSNSYGCAFLREGKVVKDAPFSCSRSGGSGKDSKPIFTVGAR